ncbi:hypothetical protein E4N98_02815 [Treponema denticola]
MLKRGNGKTYQLYKKMQKSFSKVLDIKLVYLKKFAASQLRSFAASQLRSFAASQLRSFAASQLRSFAASQLRSFAAEGGLCPNKFKYQLLKLRPKTARQ